MDFRFTPQQERFREEIRNFLQEELTGEMLEEVEGMVGGPGFISMELAKKIGQKGWLAPSWPREYGGLGLSYIEDLIAWEEMALARFIRVLVGIAIAPVILHHGNEEQKRRFLPPIARGEVEYVFGYTEPQAGTDLAALELRAVEYDDCYIMNGQKVFSTRADIADYHWLAARSDPNVPKHKGISLFVVDLKTPGITIRPLKRLDGPTSTETFYDNVRVPKENLIGEKNKGWYYIMEALDFERIYTFPVAAYLPFFSDLVSFAKENLINGVRIADNPFIRQQLATLAIEMEVGRMLNYRAVWLLDTGRISSHESAMMKVFITEMVQRLAKTGMQILGLAAPLQKGSKWAPIGGEIEHLYRIAIMPTFGAGNNEVLRDLIAIRGLGLPR